MGLFDLLRQLLGAGRRPAARWGVEELARRLGLPAPALQALWPSYRRFAIPKRSGGARQIAAPGPELKAVQRRILRRLLARLPSHPAAHGFERGRSIVTNAAWHTGKAVVVRLDLQRFFDSTTSGKVEACFRALGWDRQASRLLVRLCTLEGSLPQGAPTSPRLSNLVNRRLDARLAGLARKMNAVYTRYADDLTFSFPADDRRAVHDLLRLVKRVLAAEGYRLHRKRKLHIRRRYDRQLVTGLVVNDWVALPRRTRRWLRAVEHHLAAGREASLSPRQLAGWRSLQSMVERQAGS